MSLKNNLQLSDSYYGLLFDIRRSSRYHDRRKGFYEKMHGITSLLTIFMSGSVFFDLAKVGSTATWLIIFSVIAAFLAGLDMVVGYSKKANLHDTLRRKFVDLEVKMITSTSNKINLKNFQKERLLIEKEEPPIYLVIDGLCRNELLISEGYSKVKYSDEFFKYKLHHRLTAHFFPWNDINYTD
jgi:hypothetical protein